MKIESWHDYERACEFAKGNSNQFWSQVALQQLKWRKPWDQVSECDFWRGKVSWYSGGELNVAENCLDRHLLGEKADHRALIWISNDLKEERIFTFRQLHQEVGRVAIALERLGIQKGDRVAFYMPHIPELAISILACARIGIIHSVIFGGFSAHSIQSRVVDCGAKLIITANGCYRGSKWVELKQTVDDAMVLGCPSVQKVVVFSRHPAEARGKKNPWDLDWLDFVSPVDSSLDRLAVVHEAPSHLASDPLFILYTSGSTGKPKGVLHQMGGYLTYVSYTHQIVFQPRPDDVFWCTADMGWITGHSYGIYGPLANGTATVMFEGIPTFPDPGCFWEIIDRFQVSIFYTAPTAIRILASLGDTHVKGHSRRSLRVLGTVGEPIHSEAWRWYSEVVGEGRAPVVDTWWQTETGGILISSLAGISPTKAGSAAFPLPGIDARILDEQGKEVQGTASGMLALARSWPGQMTEVYGEPQRFFDTYFTQFPGYYFTGDAAHRDEDGFFWISGRVDDVIKVSGHRLGTAEIEAACNLHSGVAESAAVGVPDPLTGEALHLFVVFREGFISDGSPEGLMAELIRLVRKEVGPLATPQKIYPVPGLPKTRSGKIIRRLLKKVAQGQFENLGDVTTLAEPAVVERIVDVVRSP